MGFIGQNSLGLSMSSGNFGQVRRSLTPNGVYLMASFKLRHVFTLLRTSITGGRRAICALSDEKPADLHEIKALIEMGKIKTVVDRIYPLEQTADAHRYIESGNKQGFVVIQVAG
jgi:NADPH:quinone reductase-like Zn-dependent oxidoreductase